MSFIINPGISQIVLHSPEWDNTIQLNTNDIRRFTRSGDLKVFADANWAIFKINSYRFTVNHLDTITSLKAYLKLNAGLQITVIDHQGVTKTGYIITSIAEIIAERPDCSYTVTFDLMEEPT